MAERTSKKVASKASKVLSTSKSKTAKRVAASALEQATGGGTTSRKAATAASKVLQDRRFSKAARSAAASVLTQVEKSRKSK